MSEPGPDRADLTWQQLLAAYADGELDPVNRRRAEQLLEESPELREALRSQRRYSPENKRFWDELQPPDPAPHKWAQVWQRVENSLAPRAEPARWHANRSRWLRRGLLALALTLPTSAAASVALVVTFATSRSPTGAPASPDAEEKMFRLVQPDDVEIESLRHPDRGNLVVGEPPLKDSVILASAADVTLDDLQPGPDGAMPQVQIGGGDTPMILAPTREP